MTDALTTARESYGRCVLKPSFFDGFYDGLFRNAELTGLYPDLDNIAQRQLMREAVSYLFLYAENHAGGRAAIGRIGNLFGSDLYNFWVQNLMQMVEKHDHRYDEDVRAAWEEVSQSGLKRFKALSSPEK